MSQYPKWFLALNFPNIIIAMITMIFFMFGGVHPFGDVDNWFWSFIIYLFCQLFWIIPIAAFFISVISWGWMREKLAIITCLCGWIVNIVGAAIILSA